MLRLLSVLALTACAVVGTSSPNTKVVKSGEDFELSPTETAIVDQGAVTLTLVKVNEDSRCPIDVQCVWAGDVALALLVGTNSNARNPSTIHTNLDPRTTIADGYKIEAVSVQPAPRSQSTIPQSSYRITFRVSRQ
ncbi:MAG TPA: hypothetical protein VM099_03445 [Gemmatimonadaceae bacterium]|nr:hypothetical protein [Gemmatimonadaceae bacterium]